MKKVVIALTKNGINLAIDLAPQIGADVYVKEGTVNIDNSNIFAFSEPLTELVGRLFYQYDALVFIMACGIVVRTIASLIKSKTTDPAVIVMDEKGQYVISLLSGHIGGANKLATEIAEITGGVSVISTATDVNGVISFDVFAARNNCWIENIGDLKYISSELVNGGTVSLYSDCNIIGGVPNNVELLSTLDENKNYKNLVILSNRTNLPNLGGSVLYIRPRDLVIGIGCKRGISKEQIKNAIIDFMKMNNKSFESIRCLATIDLKKDEKGLLQYCKEMNLELKIIPRKEIESIEGNYTCSKFVKSKLGVASVAEPCSVLGSLQGQLVVTLCSTARHASRLICKKTTYQGITLALSEEENVYSL